MPPRPNLAAAFTAAWSAFELAAWPVFRLVLAFRLTFLLHELHERGRYHAGCVDATALSFGGSSPPGAGLAIGADQAVVFVSVLMQKS